MEKKMYELGTKVKIKSRKDWATVIGSLDINLGKSFKLYLVMFGKDEFAAVKDTEIKQACKVSDEKEKLDKLTKEFFKNLENKMKKSKAKTKVKSKPKKIMTKKELIKSKMKRIKKITPEKIKSIAAETNSSVRYVRAIARELNK